MYDQTATLLAFAVTAFNYRLSSYINFYIQFHNETVNSNMYLRLISMQQQSGLPSVQLHSRSSGQYQCDD